MTPDDFQKILESRIERIRKVLGRKAGEYSRHGDRLHNFKRGGRRLSETPERYLTQLNEKHLVSILDMVDDLDGRECANAAIWDEKIGDAINYLILLEALVTERIHENFDREIQNQRAPL